MAACERRPVFSDEKHRIVALHQEGKSTSVIATTVGRSRSVVQRIHARFKSSGSTESKPKTSRPRKTSLRRDRLMVRMSMMNRFKTVDEISR